MAHRTSFCKCSASRCLSSANRSISAAASWVDSTCWVASFSCKSTDNEKRKSKFCSKTNSKFCQCNKLQLRVHLVSLGALILPKATFAPQVNCKLCFTPRFLLIDKTKTCLPLAPPLLNPLIIISIIILWSALEIIIIHSFDLALDQNCGTEQGHHTPLIMMKIVLYQHLYFHIPSSFCTLCKLSWSSDSFKIKAFFSLPWVSTCNKCKILILFSYFQKWVISSKWQ